MIKWLFANKIKARSSCIYVGDIIVQYLFCDYATFGLGQQVVQIGWSWYPATFSWFFGVFQKPIVICAKIVAGQCCGNGLNVIYVDCCDVSEF